MNGPTFIRVDRFSPYFTGKAAISFDSIVPLEAYEYVYDLDPKQLARIAYFFAGRSGKMISKQTHTELGKAMVNWRKRFWDPEDPPIPGGRGAPAAGGPRGRRPGPRGETKRGERVVGGRGLFWG